MNCIPTRFFGKRISDRLEDWIDRMVFRLTQDEDEVPWEILKAQLEKKQPANLMEG